MVKTAVILAAGMGRRLRSKLTDKPKGFLSIENTPIIKISIEKLINCGIDNIIIGTGYLSKEYEKLSSEYPNIRCVYNGDYDKTGSMYTLYNLRSYINEDFLLLECDLLYEIVGLKILIHHSMTDVILAGELSNSHDEVFIEIDGRGFLANMSKNRNILATTESELTGITKLSLETYRKMCRYAEENFKYNVMLDYEEALVGVSKEVNIFVNRIVDFKWCEIDDENHYNRALSDIYPVIQEREKYGKGIKRNILLNPGPATTTDRVKYAQVVPDICPREKEFGKVMEFVSNKLTEIAANNEEYVTILFGGSGTAAVEAILSSVIESETVIIINNGAYGKRMCEMAQIYKLDFIEFKSSGIEPVDMNALEDTIKASGKKVSHLCVVHNETTTGLLNNITDIGELCKKYNILLIVDAMSSFAAVPLDMKKMNIAYLASSSNKNIQGMAGVSFVIANKSALVEIKNIPPRNLYLNLYLQYKYFVKNYQMRFTPPVQTLYALREAIIEAFEEGIEKRYERYSKSWEVLIEGITKLGLKYLVKKENHSKIITTIVEPENKKYDFNKMYDYFLENGITIYPGKVSDLNTFRIANIGDITSKDMERFIKLLECYLEAIKD